MSRLGAPLGAAVGFALGVRAGRAGRNGSTDRIGRTGRSGPGRSDRPDSPDGREGDRGDDRPSSEDVDQAPPPEAAAKPDTPAEVTKQSWQFVVRKTIGEFSKDQCTDLAAALTYYAVLALFPAAIALLSLVGLVGQGAQTVDTLLQILRDLGAGSVASTLEPTLMSLSEASGAGLALVLGLLAALWSASGYVNSFGTGDEPDLRDR